MIKNQDIYRATKKDLAYIPQPGHPIQMQWWYHDAIFDNGYSLEIAWMLTDTRGGICLEILDPEGNLKVTNLPFVRRNVVASTESLDIQYGDNYYRGECPKYEMHFHNGSIGVDLVFDVVATEFREPPDGAYIGRMQQPVSPIYFGYVLRPSKVSGTLTINGKKIPVSGHGYADHQWSNAARPQIFYNWNWGSVHLPEKAFSLFWWDGLMSKEHGFKRANWVWLFKDGKILEYLRDAEMYTNVSDFAMDDLSGNLYPRGLALTIDDKDVKGILKGKVNHIANMMLRRSNPVWLAVKPKESQYLRFLSNFDLDLEISGEKIQATGAKVIHEIYL